MITQEQRAICEVCGDEINDYGGKCEECGKSFCTYHNEIEDGLCPGCVPDDEIPF